MRFETAEKWIVVERMALDELFASFGQIGQKDAYLRCLLGGLE